MAQITTIQPLDFLKNSRSTINQNFTNLNVDLTGLSAWDAANYNNFTNAISALSANNSSNTSAAVSGLSAQVITNTNNINTLSANVILLSAGSGNPYANNINIVQHGTFSGNPNNDVNITGTNINVTTVNTLLNGNISLQSNNGYIQHTSWGPGTQLIDDCQGGDVGGNWLEFYRTNTLSAHQGTAYTLSDRGSWPIAGGTTEGLLFYGMTGNSSLYFGSYPSYQPSVPAIYIPSLNNANNNWPIELNGPAGITTQQITVGNKPNFGNFSTSSLSANNLVINTLGDGQTSQLSAYNILQAKATSYSIATSNTDQNGNITLYAHNGYIQHNTWGTGTQLIDDCLGGDIGGNWIEFYRTNTLSAHQGEAYVISDRGLWPNPSGPTEGLLFYGTTQNASIFIGSYTGYQNSVPALYIPSVNNSLSSKPIELVGPGGTLTRKLTVGNRQLFGAFDTPPASSVNVAIYTNNTNTVYLSSCESTTSLQVGPISAAYFSNGLLIGPYAPVHSYGAPGDIAGTVAFDTNYIYYCTTNYVNTSTNIWKRVQLSATTW